MPESCMVAGIYLERTGAFVRTALATPIEPEDTADEWHLSFEDGGEEPFYWSPKDDETVAASLSDLRSLLSALAPDIQSVGIASYGPFSSLTSSEPNFGQISAQTAHPPLNGLNLVGELATALGDDWLNSEDTRLSIHTDASACALGEVVARGTAEDEILAFLCVTWGIGLGLVQGRQILESALHPEVGLIPAYPHRSDRLVPAFKDWPMPIRPDAYLNSRSVAQLACNSAIVERFKEYPNNPEPESLADIAKSKNSKILWELRAFYLAQSCISCTTITPPHYIAIGADFDPNGDIGERTEHYFRRFLEGLEQTNQPVLSYNHLKRRTFISNAVPFPDPSPSATLASTGAAGMCYAAASATAQDKAFQVVKTKNGYKTKKNH